MKKLILEQIEFEAVLLNCFCKEQLFPSKKSKQLLLESVRQSLFGKGRSYYFVIFDGTKTKNNVI